VVAAFLRDRLNLALHAVERQPLARYGQWLRIDGTPAPAGLARASTTTGVETFRNAALADTASFTPHLLIAAGPENGRRPDRAGPHPRRPRRRMGAASPATNRPAPHVPPN
jgi:hypothetical protein